MKKEQKQNKNKKIITSDILVMLLIAGGIFLVLIGFVSYNFGESAGMHKQAQIQEDEINSEVLESAQNQQDMQEKYKDQFAVVVDGAQTHESENQYDLTIYKKDYPLINYGYTSGDDWQVVINLDQTNPEGTSLVCADTNTLNQYCENLYTYISPHKNEVETDNAIYVFRNGQLYDMIYCERVYFTSSEFKDAFEEIPTSQMSEYFE